MSRAPVRRPALFIFMTDNSMYLIDEYVNVTAGEPYRLFPFGKIIKGGKTREITRELAAKFKLPHFKPPIKRGSHNDDAPAGDGLNGGFSQRWRGDKPLLTGYWFNDGLAAVTVPYGVGMRFGLPQKAIFL